jgi:signal transduction histidine kinase
MTEKNKRRLIPIVDRAFQFKYTGVILGVAAATSSVLGAFLYGAYNEMNSMLVIVATLNQMPGAIPANIDGENVTAVFRILGASLVGEVAILGVLGLVITHRVCGPIFVVTRHLQTMIDGKHPTLRAQRAGDEFSSLFETFRALIDKSRARDDDEAKKLGAVIAAAKDGRLGDAELATLQALVDERKARLADAHNAGT